MNVTTVWAVARSEMLICRRLTRTWIIIFYIFFLTTGAYLNICLQHLQMSTAGPLGTPIPRFVVGELGSVFVTFFTFGIVFLAFDIRGRDVRERVDSIIDTKPTSNIEFVVGRLGGIVLLLCIPMLVFIVLAFIHGFLAGLAGWSIGAPIEIWSVLSFLFWDALLQLLWWGGWIMLLAVILRNRLLVFVAAMGIFWFNSWIGSKLQWGEYLVTLAWTNQIIHPSDVAPNFYTGTIVFVRVAWMLLVIGLLSMVATLLPRITERRALGSLVGVCAFGLGALLIAGILNFQSRELVQKQAWFEVHRNQEISSFPDVTHLQGTIGINPGSHVDFHVVLTVIPPYQNTTDHMTFTLNPGYKIIDLTVDSTEIGDYTFQNGLLTIPKYHFGSHTTSLAIKAKGKPDPRFAYLDARLDPISADSHEFNGSMAVYLGSKNYVFRSDYVALLPGISWYPASGVAVGRDDLQRYPKDHFKIDLTVIVPKNWSVAGPGKSEFLTGDNLHNTFRFRPENPVVDVVLIGSKFEHATIKVQEIEFTILFSGKHRKVFAAMEPTIPYLKKWITDRLMVAEQHGLHYPYDALTLVEVPSYLRILGGGWSMDSILYGPGVVMIRETGIPTARFDVKFKHQAGEQSFQQLLDYADNDLQGGNPLNGIVRNFVSYQTSPVGSGAIALQYFIEDLVGDLIVERLPYFTTNTEFRLTPRVLGQFSDDDESVSVSVSAGSRNTPPRKSLGGTIVARWQNTNTSTNWSTIEETALSDLHFDTEPIKSYYAILLRNTYALYALKEWVDGEVLGNILRELLQHYRGLNFSFEEFRKIAISHVPQFDEITQNWINTNRLPGYVVSDPVVEQIATDESDAQIYQTTFKLRNVESIPGFVQIAWIEEKSPISTNEQSSGFGYLPIQLIEPHSAYRFAIKSDFKLTSVTIDVPMSLNRQTIVLPVSSEADVEMNSSNSRPTVQPIQWNPLQSDQVIIDDLDSGFTVSGIPKEPEFPWYVPTFVEEMILIVNEQSEDIDRGLPIYDKLNVNLQWTRANNSGFGRFRNTFTRVPSVPTESAPEDLYTAEFAANLPHTGMWRLSYSVPGQILLEHMVRNHDHAQLGTNNYESKTQDEFAMTVNVRINKQRIPLELNLSKLQNEVHDATWGREFAPDNMSERQLTRFLEDLERSVDDCYWIDLGSFSITDPHVVVQISNNSSQHDTFADAVRWTYLKVKE